MKTINFIQSLFHFQFHQRKKTSRFLIPSPSRSEIGHSLRKSIFFANKSKSKSQMILHPVTSSFGLSWVALPKIGVFTVPPNHRVFHYKPSILGVFPLFLYASSVCIPKQLGWFDARPPFPSAKLITCCPQVSP